MYVCMYVCMHVRLYTIYVCMTLLVLMHNMYVGTCSYALPSLRYPVLYTNTQFILIQLGMYTSVHTLVTRDNPQPLLKAAPPCTLITPPGHTLHLTCTLQYSQTIEMKPV